MNRKGVGDMDAGPCRYTLLYDLMIDQRVGEQ